MFVFVELIIALNFRSMRYSIFKAFPHKWLLFAIASQFALIAVLIQIPTVRRAFGVAMPSASDIGVIVVICLIVLCSMEIVKAVLRRKMRTTGGIVPRRTIRQV